jgi:hypothetical protein
MFTSKLKKVYNLYNLKNIKLFLKVRVIKDKTAKKIWLVYNTYIKKNLKKVCLRQLKVPKHVIA